METYTTSCTTLTRRFGPRTPTWRRTCVTQSSSSKPTWNQARTRLPRRWRPTPYWCASTSTTAQSRSAIRGREHRRNTMGQLDGRVAIVTGASRGIGKEIALLFAREGARVVAAARTEHEGDHQLPGGIAETVAEARDGGGEATAVRADISQTADIEHLIAATHEAYGPVDVLVNNAALTYYVPIADFPLKRWQRMLDVDLTAPFLLAQAVIPDMLAAGRGNIVNISSLAARHPDGPPYALPGRGGTTYG